MKPAIFITGQQTYLRSLARADLPALLNWTTDREVTRYLYRGAFPAHLETLERAYEAMLNSSIEAEVAIGTREDDVLIGIGGLHNINTIAHSAELRILLGEKRYWGKGHGTEATQLLLAWAFEVLNLHKVWLGVNAAQANAVRVYEKVGFTREGLLRDEIWRNGRYYDAARMSLLAAEYRVQREHWLCAAELAAQFVDSFYP
ncbi:(ribosomal protein S5)-alanine N-acetyltransferase [Gammaproteobacteria bacterium]